MSVIPSGVRPSIVRLALASCSLLSDVLEKRDRTARVDENLTMESPTFSMLCMWPSWSNTPSIALFSSWMRLSVTME